MNIKTSPIFTITFVHLYKLHIRVYYLHFYGQAFPVYSAQLFKLEMKGYTSRRRRLWGRMNSDIVQRLILYGAGAISVLFSKSFFYWTFAFGVTFSWIKLHCITVFHIFCNAMPAAFQIAYISRCAKSVSVITLH